MADIPTQRQLSQSFMTRNREFSVWDGTASKPPDEGSRHTGGETERQKSCRHSKTCNCSSGKESKTTHHLHNGGIWAFK